MGEHDGGVTESRVHHALTVEHDYLTALSDERTFLAWERTAVGLLSAAVAVEFVPALRIPGPPHVLAIALAVVGMLTSGIGLLRWMQIDRAARAARRPVAQPRSAEVTTAAAPHPGPIRGRRTQLTPRDRMPGTTAGPGRFPCSL
ncbi:YidH family protein [Mycobacterium sp.]|uniref:YidH family protein n=1 Tax=Mycobacterium sp. TaxID=1785 RepID=UPI0039C949DE